MRISSGFVFLTPVVFLLCGLLPADGATLYGSFTPLAQGAQVDLTTDGPLDWVHWGLYTETSVNRKATVTPQISNYTLIAPTNSWTFV